jgi:ABC-2 type transport system ATP-binding protein
MPIPAISVKNVSKIYSPNIIALDDASFTVADGDFFALLGPNGAGKSTTINIITSLINKSAGHVEIFGHDIDTQRNQAKMHVGIVPQEFNFNMFEQPMDIILNAAGYYGLPRKLAKVRAEYYLKKTNLWDKRHEQSRSLSGGMKRRLMIARALMHEPKLLILDEPTAGVDIEIRRSIWEFVSDLNKNHGVTVILTTHYFEEAENLCRNIAILNHGKIVENTSMHHLLSRFNQQSYLIEHNPKTIDTARLGCYASTVHSEQELEIAVEKEQSLSPVLEHLLQQGLEINSIRQKHSRLEELFLNLVDNKSD